MPDPTPVKTDAQGEKVPGSGEKTLWVVSNRTDARVALWEKDDAHPGGEAFVAGPVPEEVAATPSINLALRNQEIREATPEEVTKRQKQLGPSQAPAKGHWD